MIFNSKKQEYPDNTMNDKTNGIGFERQLATLVIPSHRYGWLKNITRKENV
jgi:hypothetical protein